MNIALAYGFAMCAHRNQRRKYTGDLYFRHCMEVADIVSEYTIDEDVIAAAALHDTIEDTDVTYEEIARIFGKRIADLVSEVTDVSKPEDGNRAIRKELDRINLSKSSPDGANIKLADIISNTSSIVQYDVNFAKVYLREKEKLLPFLKHGNPMLWERAGAVLINAREQIV